MPSRPMARRLPPAHSMPANCAAMNGTSKYSMLCNPILGVDCAAGARLRPGVQQRAEALHGAPRRQLAARRLPALLQGLWKGLWEREGLLGPGCRCT